MIQISTVVLLFCLTVLYNLEYNVCGAWEYERIRDLPFQIVHDLLTIINQGEFSVIPRQTRGDAELVRFWLFTRQNPNNATILNSVEQLNDKKQIKILIHGWGGNHDVEYIRIIKDAYLEKYDYNVISVDYSVYAKRSYPIAVAYVSFVGTEIAKFICKLIAEVRPKLLHVIGHSLGAQVAGTAGHEMKKLCQATIERITGLDPAGPIFNSIFFLKKWRLDSQDAKFVDVIHTNNGVFGYTKDCGIVDFHVNCGFYQPGCGTFANIIFEILDLSHKTIVCHHLRSCHLFVESIRNDSFYALSCHRCGEFHCYAKFENGDAPTNVYMGESCWTKPPESKYLVLTNEEPPYAKGPPRSHKESRCK